MNILIVDDNKTNLLLLSSLAKSAVGAHAQTFEDPLAALQWCASEQPDLVLVDYRMPCISGIEFIKRFRLLEHMHDVPIIMVTTENEREVRREALSEGATDFLAKPVDSSEFKLRVRNLLALRQSQILLQDRAKLLQHEIEQATRDLLAREHELVLRLVRAAEFRDPETGAHISRMAHYSRLIARRLGLSEQYQQDILEAAPMHDVGKLGTPDHILLKPGRLTPEELIIMRQHADIGGQILAGSESSLIRLAEEIARSHHEKYDGSGYPAGLRGEDIPLSGRIVAVADVFDALTSERPYKKAWPLEEARQFLLDNIGAHFCPKCAHAFLDGWDEVLEIRANFPD